MVLRVVPGELAAARTHLDDGRNSSSQFHVDSGSEGVFGSAVLASAAARFAAGHEQQVRHLVSRAGKDADGLLSAQQGYASIDQEAADGAHRLAAALPGSQGSNSSTGGDGATSTPGKSPVTYRGLTS